MFSHIFYDAKAYIKGGKEYPKINGVVYFKEVKNGVFLIAKVDGLPESNNKCTGNLVKKLPVEK